MRLIRVLTEQDAGLEPADRKRTETRAPPGPL